MSASPLDRLRAAGLSVEVTASGLRVHPEEKLTPALWSLIRKRGTELRAGLLRDVAERELDLVPVDPTTGRPVLSSEKPAAPAQAAHLRELAIAPELPENAPDVVERALESGLTEAGADELIGGLGNAIARARRTSIGPSPPAGGGTCQNCGRDIGPTSTRCGSCKQSSRDPRNEGPHDDGQGPNRTEDPKVHKRENRGKALKRTSFDHYRTPPNARGGTDSSTK